MTELASLLAQATDRLRAAGVPSPRHDAEAIAAHVLGVPRTQLAGVGEPDSAAQAAFTGAVRRRCTREPLQHITGRAPFRYLDLEVGPGVFIPRPETEVMTGVAVDELSRLAAVGAAPIAVDLCTGSGAVAVALATESPTARVIGLDLSTEAVAYARRNAEGCAVDIIEGDLADAPVVLADLAGHVHVVTANPPYIPLDAWESVDAEARTYDPDIALWSGDDGLDAIRVVARVAADLVVDGGLVLCEHADVQGESAPQVFAEAGYWIEIRDHADLAGRSRFVTARRVPRSAHPAGTIGP